MALYRGTIAVSQIVGKIGDVDYMRWRNKNVVRQSPKIVTNPSTPAQQNQRIAMQVANSRFRNILNPDQRTRWESYAQRMQTRFVQPGGVRQIVQGNKGEFTGMNAYILVNTKMVSAGLVMVDDPPLNDPKPEGPSAFGASWNGIGLVVDCSWQIPPAPAANDTVRIWCDSVSELFHRQIVDIPLVSAGLSSFGFVRGNAGASLALSTLSPTLILVQADGMGQFGGVMPPTETVEVQI